MTSERKDNHVALAMDQNRGVRGRNDFDDVELLHHALGGIDPAVVSLGTTVGGVTWDVPFYINGMTGGSTSTGEINRTLAIAARETGIPMASGSMSIALKDPSQIPTFQVIREENPDGFVMANLGADHGVDNALRVIDLLQADALQIHVNAMQETVMPEGSRDFSAWPATIEAVVAAVPVPVVVKEVGFGLSRRTIETLAGLGVTVADVSGRGGTNFARIENSRRAGGDYAYLEGWGQSTVSCLLDAPGDFPTLLASGGVRNPLDVLKALALGAKGVGVAGTFLALAVDGGVDALVTEINRWKEHLAQLMATVGAPTVPALTGTDLLVRGSVREFCELRGIDAAALSARSAAANDNTRGGRHGR